MSPWPTLPVKSIHHYGNSLSSSNKSLCKSYPTIQFINTIPAGWEALTTSFPHFSISGRFRSIQIKQRLSLCYSSVISHIQLARAPLSQSARIIDTLS